MGDITVFYKKSASLNAIKCNCAGTVHTPGVSLKIGYF